MGDVTRVLSKIEAGDPSAAEQLLPLVYEELRRLAYSRMTAESPSHTLQGTALVHEAYLRLVDVEHIQKWASRGHFFAAAAEAMRRILIDQARRKRSQREGGALQRHALDQVEILTAEPSIDILVLNDVLQRFEALDKRKSDLVKLRYFAGLTVPQAAEALGISTATAEREWAYARAWLHSELKRDAV